MPDRVHFIIQENTWKKLGAAVEDLLADLRMHSVEVVMDSVKPLAVESQEPEPYKDARNILYITDDDAVYRMLREQNRYVLPYLHEDNQSAAFAGAKYLIEELEQMDYEAVEMAYRRLAGLPWEIATTRRCIIRETTVEDVDAFYRIYEEPEITAYMEPLYTNREEETGYLREYIEKIYGFYGYGLWTVVERESGQVIGRAGISWREGFRLPELGFVIGVPWQRKGYAYEVCRAILRYAKEIIGFKQVQALVMEGNESSIGLCQKLGFKAAEKVTVEEEEYIKFIIHL